MMFDWNGYRAQILKGIADLTKLSPGTLRGYRELSQAGTPKDLSVASGFICGYPAQK